MAKATAKNVKLSLNQREKLIFLLPSITSSFDKQKGEVISWSSAGKMGFRGSKRTLHTAQMAAEDCSKSIEAGLKSEGVC
jgi:small subunit ribosomal protein S11